MFFSEPVTRLSTHITLCPSFISASQRCDPINPAPPVTRDVSIQLFYSKHRIPRIFIPNREIKLYLVAKICFFPFWSQNVGNSSCFSQHHVSRINLSNFRRAIVPPNIAKKSEIIFPPCQHHRIYHIGIGNKHCVLGCCIPDPGYEGHGIRVNQWKGKFVFYRNKINKSRHRKDKHENNCSNLYPAPQPSDTDRCKYVNTDDKKRIRFLFEAPLPQQCEKTSQKKTKD